MIKNFKKFLEISGTELVGHMGPGYPNQELRNTINKEDTSCIESDTDNKIYTEDDYESLYIEYLKKGGKPLFGYSKNNLEKVLSLINESNKEEIETEDIKKNTNEEKVLTDDQKKEEIFEKLILLGGKGAAQNNFLIMEKGLGMKNIISSIIESFSTPYENPNLDYQVPLSLLFKTGKYNSITYENGMYDSKFFGKVKSLSIIKDKNGQYDYINKLSTNINDICDLLVDLFYRGSKFDFIYETSKDINKFKEYLLSIKDKLKDTIIKYYPNKNETESTINELRKFTKWSKLFTEIGNKNENIVRKILEKKGMKIEYSGGDGDLVDMLYGCDLIASYNDKIYTFQIKSKLDSLEKAYKISNYYLIDFFACPESKTKI